MKKLLVIAASIGILVVSGSVAYYLLVVSPKIAADQLELERQKQAATAAQEKAELKQKCIEARQEAAASNRTSLIPSYAEAEAASVDCDNL